MARHADMDVATPRVSAAIPLAGTEPSLPEDDLAPLLERLVETRLIGLGEATHDDHESFAFKRRLIQALVRRHARDVVIFERNAAKMDAYDRFVTGARDALPMGEELYPWRTEEVADLFHRLCDWNGRGDAVRLACIDMFSPAVLTLALALHDGAGISSRGGRATARRRGEQAAGSGPLACHRPGPPAGDPVAVPRPGGPDQALGRSAHRHLPPVPRLRRAPP